MEVLALVKATRAGDVEAAKALLDALQQTGASQKSLDKIETATLQWAARQVTRMW